MDTDKLIYDLSMACTLASLRELEHESLSEAETDALKTFRRAYRDFKTKLKPSIDETISELLSL